MEKKFLQIQKCFEYLQLKAGAEITFQELRGITGWTEENLTTNNSKRIREFLTNNYSRGTPIEQRTYQINRNILNISEEVFYDLFRQKKNIFSHYDHKKHRSVKTYDFFSLLQMKIYCGKI